MEPYIKNQDLLDMIGDFSGTPTTVDGQYVALRFHLKRNLKLDRYIKLVIRGTKQPVLDIRVPKTLKLKYWSPVILDQPMAMRFFLDTLSCEGGYPQKWRYESELWDKVQSMMFELEKERLNNIINWKLWPFSCNRDYFITK